MRILISCLLVTAMIVACGPSEDPGTGSGTLEVVARIEVTEQLDNASDPNDFETKATVEVSRAGLEIADALVLLTLESGSPVELALEDAGKGRYRADWVGYQGTFELEVEAGDDYIRDVLIQGPDLHTIAAPTAGQLIPAGQDLEVVWNRDLEADQAELETKKAKLTVADTGSHILGGANFPGKPDKPEEDHLTIRRSRRVGLAGGVAGSELVVTVRNRIEFQVDTAP